MGNKPICYKTVALYALRSPFYFESPNMSAQIAVHGRLVADPMEHQTQSGVEMATGRLAVSVPCRDADDGYATLWLTVVAFSRQAGLLLKHQKGDLISTSGQMQVTQWTDQDNAQREGMQLLADTVISARTVRPGGSRKKTEKPIEATTETEVPDAFNDEIKF
jgi:single-stranded DNA-binding protein